MKPQRLPIKQENIPPVLRNGKKWICWRWEQRNGRWTKPPYTVTGAPAKSNDPATWDTFPNVFKAYESGEWDGVGYVIAQDDYLCGIDFDDCLDPATGETCQEIWEHIKRIDSYTEISPSAKGYKTLLLGKLPQGGHHGEKVGVFDQNRYFCITGQVLAATSPNIELRQEELDQFVKAHWPQDFEPRANPPPQQETHHNLADDEIIRKAINANDGGKFRRLWEGDFSEYRSQSEADFALCNKLAFWVGPDSARIDALFQQSGLYREKWNRDDYRSRTIQNAIAQITETYTPKKPKPTALLCLGSIRTQFKESDVKWIWREHIPAGMPIIINGREGIGKTTNAMQMAKEILDDYPQNSVVWIASEGFMKDSYNKADHLGLDEARFFFLRNHDETFQFNFSYHKDRKFLDEALAEAAGQGLPTIALFIDSIRGISPYDDNESKIKNVMMPLNAIVCDKHSAALVYLDHWGKGQKENLLDKAVGSTAKTAAVRAVFSILPDTSYTRSIQCAKINLLGQEPVALKSAETAHGIIIYRSEEKTDYSQAAKAEKYLIEIFSLKPQYSAQHIYEDAEKNGIGSETLKKAKKKLGIESVRGEGIGSTWDWKCSAFIR